MAVQPGKPLLHQAPLRPGVVHLAVALPSRLQSGAAAQEDARHPRFESGQFAAGHGPIGISLAPITGKLAGQLVAGEEPVFALDALRVDRFG